MKSKLIIGLVIIIIFGGFAFYSFRSSLNPYVTFNEAAQLSRQVQVLGQIVRPEEISYNLEVGDLQFYLADDEGTVMLVSYNGTRPDNLEDSENVVAVGYYNDGIFKAEKLLVKCPSKYENQESGGSS